MAPAKTIVIEHMEERPTRWLIAEYIEAAEEAGRLGFNIVFTGVRDPVLQSVLAREGLEWRFEHSWELYDTPRTVVLDLWAPRDLEPGEAESLDYYVIGGIMGDHPPRGRGRLLSWMFESAAKRRLGPYQMSIHVAAWAAAMVARGTPVDRLPVVYGASVRVRTPMGELEVELPYAYPRGPGGRGVVPERIRRVLEHGVLWDEDSYA